MLTLSLVMIPWDWIGIVMIRSDTRCTRSTNGTMNNNPGPRALSLTLPSSNSTTRSYCLMMRTDITRPKRTTRTSTAIT